MSATHGSNIDSYNLKGFLKKCGFDRWRYVFSGYNAYSGEKAFFTIELYVTNPALSPDVVQCSKVDPLAGSLDTSVLLAPQEIVPHSFVSLRFTFFSKTAQIFESLYPTKSLLISKRDVRIDGTDFVMDSKALRGSITEEQGIVSWNLNMDRQSVFLPSLSKKDMCWSASGAMAQFSGEVVVHGESYIVTPITSYGYIDKNWGRSFIDPFFHLSCSHLRSTISGLVMRNSGFAIQGMFDESFAVFADIQEGNQQVKINCSKTNAKSRFTCTAVEDSLHWTVSVLYRNYLLDLDVFCKTKGMAIHSYSYPANPQEELQVLGGANGTGELKLYKRAGKVLELIEQAAMEDVFCEYGRKDQPADDA
ncbi:MAG: hypothetical protein J6B81_01365 [Spirochaetaceae bacterium]|nr:hypothetical protein [Spirochaetaceae bacterium]